MEALEKLRPLLLDNGPDQPRILMTSERQLPSFQGVDIIQIKVTLCSPSLLTALGAALCMAFYLLDALLGPSLVWCWFAPLLLLRASRCQLCQLCGRCLRPL